MSTRSVIARATAGGFTGVYHHWDGYPSGLGATLFELFNGHFKRNLPNMLKYLIDDHPAGWSTINGADFNLAPGYGSSGPQCYCHGGRSEEPQKCTERNSQGCGCEWAYVFRKVGGVPTMDILSSYHPEGGKMIGMFGCGNPDAKWYRVASVDLTASEPNWKAIENFEPIQPVLN